MIEVLAGDLSDRGLHRVLPGTGLALLGCVLAATILAHSLLVSVGMLGLVLALAAWSEGSLSRWLRSLRFVALFASFLFLAQALSVRTGDVAFRLWIPITHDGLLLGGKMALRFVVILSMSFLYVVTTDPDRLADALIRCGIPYRYGYLLILALRFVPFFRQELRVVREAQRMRGIKVSVRSVRRLRQAIAYTFVPVLVSGLVRVDTIAMSMKGRGFGLHTRRTLPPAQSPKREDVLIWICCAGIVAVIVLTRRYG